jgi:signal peptidase I
VKTAERESLEDPEPNDEKKRHGILGFLGEVPGLVLMAFVLALIIRTFLFQAFFIPSPSMEPTLIQGDRVLVNKIPYYFHDPRRGDIIVFSNPNPQATPDRGFVGGFFHWLFQGLGFQQPENEDFIKRVIGLPGDTIEINNGIVKVNGFALDEPYIRERFNADYARAVVPPQNYFVLGDNRNNSSDSRNWGFVPEGNIIGKAQISYWPTDSLGGVGNRHIAVGLLRLALP